MKIVIGLGNPGEEYYFTRHNIGFRVIEEFARQENLIFKAARSNYSLIASGLVKQEKLILVKPQTYMNLSGRAVSRVVNYYRIDLENLLVVYDDLYLKLGQIRIRKKGSAGGHNGMESIIQALGSEEIPRIRVGIGIPSSAISLYYKDYVLSNFTEEEEQQVVEVIGQTVKAIRRIFQDGFEKAMREYN
ncbi:MAG: aminoacyl-tRNA hydrolase [Candidatus Caldatribacteriota bacterium]